MLRILRFLVEYRSQNKWKETRKTDRKKTDSVFMTTTHLLYTPFSKIMWIEGTLKVKRLESQMI
jgi:hypothetical protein